MESYPTERSAQPFNHKGHMRLQDNQLRQFEIDGQITLGQLAAGGFYLTLRATEGNIPNGFMTPVNDSGRDEYWTRPHWEKALRDTEALKLPTPRLQLTWVDDGDNWQYKSCLYSLVIPLRELDIRAECDERGVRKTGVRKEHHALIGATTLTGGGGAPVRDNGEIYSPYRDGAHAKWDSDALGGLPIYVVCNGQFNVIENRKDT